MAIPILETIGLTPKEVEVYTTLLRVGECPIADILKETHDHPQVVYRALDGLVAQKLVIVSYRRHRKYVRAEDPHALEKIEEQRLKEVRQTIPELLALQKGSKDAIVRVDKGNEAVRTLRLKGVDELTAGDTYCIIGASGDRFYEIMADQYAEIERKRIKKGIHRKLLAYVSQKPGIEKHDTWYKLAEFRYLPEDNSAPSSTNIFGSTVAIIVWEAEPLVITIQSQSVAQSYIKYFETLWQMAKP